MLPCSRLLLPADPVPFCSRPTRSWDEQGPREGCRQLPPLPSPTSLDRWNEYTYCRLDAREWVSSGCSVEIVVLLIRRADFSRSLCLTRITGADGTSLANTAKYGAYIDLVTIMAYDMYASAWSATTGPNAPLYQCNANSGESRSVSRSGWSFPTARQPS